MSSHQLRRCWTLLTAWWDPQYLGMHLYLNKPIPNCHTIYNRKLLKENTEKNSAMHIWTSRDFTAHTDEIVLHMSNILTFADLEEVKRYRDVCIVWFGIAAHHSRVFLHQRDDQPRFTAWFRGISGRYGDAVLWISPVEIWIKRSQIITRALYGIYLFKLVYFIY